MNLPIAHAAFWIGFLAVALIAFVINTALQHRADRDSE